MIEITAEVRALLTGGREYGVCRDGIHEPADGLIHL